MDPRYKSSRMCVIIINSGITGLTLAHYLDKAGVDYILLEKHQNISANLGGSIGLQANECRILKQLGVYNHLEQWMNDSNFIANCFPNGFTRVYYTASYS